MNWRYVVTVVSLNATVNFSRGEPSLSHQPHIHRRHPAALCPHHDWVDLHVGEMIAVRGENVGQADHGLHQRIDIARSLAAHALTAQLLEHFLRLVCIDGQQGDRRQATGSDFYILTILKTGTRVRLDR